MIPSDTRKALCNVYIRALLGVYAVVLLCLCEGTFLHVGTVAPGLLAPVSNWPRELQSSLNQQVMQEVVKLLAPLNTTKLEGYAEGTDISSWMRAGVPGEASFSLKWFFFSFIIPGTRKRSSTHSLVEVY